MFEKDLPVNAEFFQNEDSLVYFLIHAVFGNISTVI